MTNPSRDSKERRLSPEKRTEDLIATLAGTSALDLTAGTVSLRPPTFVANWLLGGSIVLALSLWLLPVREDLADRTRAIDYSFLLFLWLAATVLSALRVYQLAFPDARVAVQTRDWGRFAPLPLALLAAWTVWNLNLTDFGYQLSRDSHLANGGCGAVILTAGALHAGFLFYWLRRGATTDPVRAGAWAAVSTGAHASFLVQFACAQEQPLHVILWHFVPITLLAGIAALVSRRLLRW